MGVRGGGGVFFFFFLFLFFGLFFWGGGGVGGGEVGGSFQVTKICVCEIFRFIIFHGLANLVFVFFSFVSVVAFPL